MSQINEILLAVGFLILNIAFLIIFISAIILYVKKKSTATFLIALGSFLILISTIGSYIADIYGGQYGLETLVKLQVITQIIKSLSFLVFSLGFILFSILNLKKQ